MRRTLEERIRHRARNSCEYCRMPQPAYDLRFQIDHVIARQHGGSGGYGNLALACTRWKDSKWIEFYQFDLFVALGPIPLNQP
jgi:5-methylcytosine-specific restriction endonuclease McrA